jgi:hypothetical protein
MHMNVAKPLSWVFIIAIGITVAATPMWAGPQEEFKETYNALAVSMGTSNPPVIPQGARTTVQINITRWSTDEERAALLTQLIENGQEALNKALNKQKETGWIRATGPTAEHLSQRAPALREGVQGRRRQAPYRSGPRPSHFHGRGGLSTAVEGLRRDFHRSRS